MRECPRARADRPGGDVGVWDVAGRPQTATSRQHGDAATCEASTSTTSTRPSLGWPRGAMSQSPMNSAFITARIGPRHQCPRSHGERATTWAQAVYGAPSSRVTRTRSIGSSFMVSPARRRTTRWAHAERAGQIALHHRHWCAGGILQRLDERTVAVDRDEALGPGNLPCPRIAGLDGHVAVAWVSGRRCRRRHRGTPRRLPRQLPGGSRVPAR